MSNINCLFPNCFPIHLSLIFCNKRVFSETLKKNISKFLLTSFFNYSNVVYTDLYNYRDLILNRGLCNVVKVIVSFTVK